MALKTGLLLENYDRNGFARVVGLELNAMAIGTGKCGRVPTVRYYYQTNAGVEILDSVAAEKKDSTAFAQAAASGIRVIGCLRYYSIDVSDEGKVTTLREHRDMGDGVKAVIDVSEEDFPHWAKEQRFKKNRSYKITVVEDYPYVVGPKTGE